MAAADCACGQRTVDASTSALLGGLSSRERGAATEPTPDTQATMDTPKRSDSHFSAIAPAATWDTNTDSHRTKHSAQQRQLRLCARRGVERCTALCSAASDSADGLPRARPSPARRRAHAVLGLIGEVRVGRPRDVAHGRVVARPLVLVVHEQRDRRAQRVAALHPAEQRHAVLLSARRRQRRLPGPPAAQLPLHVLRTKAHARRHSVHDAAHARAVAFPERCHTERNAERRHGTAAPDDNATGEKGAAAHTARR